MSVKGKSIHFNNGEEKLEGVIVDKVKLRPSSTSNYAPEHSYVVRVFSNNEIKLVSPRDITKISVF